MTNSFPGSNPLQPHLLPDIMGYIFSQFHAFSLPSEVVVWRAALASNAIVLTKLGPNHLVKATLSSCLDLYSLKYRYWSVYLQI